jgi:hypothetical protein
MKRRTQKMFERNECMEEQDHERRDQAITNSFSTFPLIPSLTMLAASFIPANGNRRRETPLLLSHCGRRSWMFLRKSRLKREGVETTSDNDAGGWSEQKERCKRRRKERRKRRRIGAPFLRCASSNTKSNVSVRNEDPSLSLPHPTALLSSLRHEKAAPCNCDEGNSHKTAPTKSTIQMVDARQCLLFEGSSIERRNGLLCGMWQVS